LPIVDCTSAEEAEARAILAGLKLGLDHDLKVTRVESDCTTTAVKSTNSPESITSSIWSVYRDISYTRSLYSGCQIVQTGRNLNGDAHDLAKLAARSVEVNVWVPPLPDDVLDICNRNIALSDFNI
jgi:hypothetical protein